ncbi:MAG: hypothetical protein HY326_08465 [Chloroflexi bacterium]|nr:hypothetical protein [Chloroflexota bacterium]
MGHIARLLEEAGIATVIIGIRAFQHRMARMMLPRMVITPNLMGRPLGAPGDPKGQRATILAALDLLQSAKHASAIVELPEVYDPLVRKPHDDNRPDIKT